MNCHVDHVRPITELYTICMAAGWSATLAIAAMVGGLFPIIGACGDSAQRDSVPPPATAPSVSAAGQPGAQPQGSLRGQVVRPPGRDPRSGIVAANVPVSGDPIVVRDGAGDTVASAVTGQDGSFQVRLAPGGYLVVESICKVSRQVSIRRGAISSVTLTIPNVC
ncbi:hypothetical protein GTS_50120 [Gandjariella thermophila]|uniref:Carboxypeptidase regulatory-like domain-containing protein n=2 Tax=Gandjariella thermophila TaxID=1931992 RepID=A0A4D4JGD2_9PSEU|nr:hypothetical protein GTS_50120 [Gandjariella thermophila]